MCRIAAYLGPPISLAGFLTAPPHSLHRQSWAPREQLTATVNADGFGVAWVDGDRRPAVYTSISPAWADPNLDGLGRSLVSPLWLGNVRSATAGMTVNLANTQPFVHGSWLYTHNGFIQDFAHALRPRLNRFLEPHIQADIVGTTDSEYLFALLRQLLERDPDVPTVLRQTADALESWLADEAVLLNLVISDGRSLYALRHALNHDAPTLYYSADSDWFPDGQVVASEPLDDGGFWHPIPAAHVLLLDPDRPPELRPL